MQNIAKLNNQDKAICVNTNPQSILNGLNRNYSFIYDHNSKRYESHFEETEDDDFDSVREGYWGHIRDRNADRKQIDIKSEKQNSYDGYWGTFKDTNFDVNTDKIGLTIPGSNNDEIYGSLKSNSPSMMSLSSSINSLSRFKDSYMDEEESPFNRAASIFDKYEKKLNYDYNYKTSKLKIQACKRDDMKILMQSLEDQESNFKKEIIKSFDSSCLNINTNQTSSSSLTYSTQTKQINFLHFSNKSTEDTERSNAHNNNNNSSASSVNNNNNNNLNNFKNVFNTLTKLKKSINIFNGDYLNLNRADLLLSFINNVHASMNDVDGFIFNYLYEKDSVNNSSQNDVKRQTTNVSLCSNIYETINPASELKEKMSEEKSQKLFGNGNHSTMLFEYQNVKIGFMALIDNPVFEKLNTAIHAKIKKNSMEEKDVSSSGTNNQIEYTDYITECDRLSKQLRMCGANVIVVLTNMDEQNEQKLVREGSDLDIVFSSSQSNLPASGDNIKKFQVGNRWIIKSGTNFDCVSLVSLNLDALNSNKILDIAITNYLIE